MTAEYKTPQPLSAESKKYLQLCDDLKLPRYDAGTVEDARAISRKINRLAAGEFEYDGKRTEVFVPSPEVAGGIPVYIYVPTKHSPNPTILIYFHGGGTVVGDRMNVDTCCKMLSTQGNCIVLNVEYRLSPEDTFPASLDDSVVVAKWTLANKEQIGGGTVSKVGVSGDSAGGQISASISHEVPGIAFQILVYPHLSARGDRSLKSYQEYKYFPGLDMKIIDWYENLMAHVDNWRNPRFANLLRDKFDHLPPCLLIVAECDPLREDSYEYVKKLNAAGVHNELYLEKGAVHQYFTLPGTFKDSCHASYDRAIAFLRKWGSA